MVSPSNHDTDCIDVSGKASLCEFLDISPFPCNQRFLLPPAPSFQSSFPCDSIMHILKNSCVHKMCRAPFHCIAIRKCTKLMLIQSQRKITRHTNIQSVICTTKDVDNVLMHSKEACGPSLPLSRACIVLF